VITRRQLIPAAVGAGLLSVGPAWAAGEASLADELEFPDYNSIEDPVSFGFGEPSHEQIDRAAAVIHETDDLITKSAPRMSPADVAASFISRYSSDPEIISQWPAPSAWNPLVVAFLRSTGYPAHNDMIAWCAAFVNWCIEHSLGKQHTSGSASSQSFLGNPRFRATSAPTRGDLAVFTVYDRQTGRPVSPPLGHVAFVSVPPTASKVTVLGGNQSANGRSSIISEKSFPTTPFPARRHIDGKYVVCTMQLNKYMSIAP
jgi:uncharacterized protein (TIGR02594 family)